METNLENVPGGFELGLLLLLLRRGAGDALVHAGFGSRPGEVLVQLNLRVVQSNIWLLRPACTAANTRAWEPVAAGNSTN